MQYRLILGALAITMMPLMGKGQDILHAENSTVILSLANKFDGKGAETIRDVMPTQEKLDEAARLKVEESYGKLPMSFIRNDGQLNKQVQYYEKGAGHATYFTKQGVYLSLAGRTGHKAGSGEMGYGPRITESRIQSNPKVLDLFLISCGEPLSQIQNLQTPNKIWANKLVHATPVNNLKPETSGEQSLFKVYPIV